MNEEEPRSGETMLATGASPWLEIGPSLAAKRRYNFSHGRKPVVFDWHSALAPREAGLGSR